jgi:hypothetical protein
MNDFEHRLRRSIRTKLRFLVGAGAGSCLLLIAGVLRADQPPLGSLSGTAAATTGPIWVSPISPYDPGEGTAGAHAVQIGAAPHGGYVQTSAYAQTGADLGAYQSPYVGPAPSPAPSPAPEQLPPGGYLWGGSPSAPGPAGSYPSAGYSVAGSAPPPESVGPPPSGNLLGGLGFGVSAPIGIPPLGPLISDRPILLMPNISPDAFHTTFRLHQSITDEVGDDGPITSLGGFFPHTTDKGLWFLDAQFNLLEDADNPGQQTENFGANIGLGWRWILPDLDAVGGLSFWYDLDRTRPDFVHQAAVSGELLGDLWQLRVNGYFPCGTNRISTFSALGPAYYAGENIDFGQTRYDNLDMAGTDFEIGRRLPGWLGENGVSAYIGGYYYRADQAFSTFGVMTRLEALISPNLTIDAKFSNDPLFKNKVGIGITYLLPNGKCKSCAAETCSEVYRLTEPVVRNRTVVYATQTLNTPQVALNPATGTPIIVVHVDSAAPAGGNGTVNMPYNTLPAAQAGSAPNDIILVQGGSMFSGQSIDLQNSQRFLGEGIPHTVATVQEGTITLPTTSASTVLPIIANSPGDAVTLANSNEVSGFTINNSGGAAIAGNGIAGTANINNVAVNGGTTGISIQNSSAAVTVTAMPIVGAATGINLQNNTGSFDFVGMQTVTGSTATGVLLSGNSAPVTFDNLQISATTGTGLSATNQTGLLTITTGAISAAAGTGVNIDNSAIATAAPLAITLASVNSAGGTNGINLNNTAGTFTVSGSGTTAGSGGTIGDSTGAGVAITGESGTVALNYMNINNPVGDGIDVTNTAAAGTVTLTGAQIALAGTQTGVNVNGNSGTLNLNGATVTGGGVGLNVAGSSGTENVASFTATNAATGINLATDTGTFNATGTTTVTGSTVDGVDLSTNAGPVAFANLQMNATTGTGLAVLNQTGTLTISAGAITAADGTGVSINNGATTPAPLAITLASVNASGGTNGINLNNAAGNFTVIGSGTTTGSGGTISDTTGAGVAMMGESGTVALNYMNITNPAGDGVDVNNSAAGANVTLTGTQIALSGSQFGVNVNQNSGTFTLDGATVTGGGTALRIQNSSGTNDLANFTATNSATGILVNNNTGTIDATGTTTVTGSTNNGVRVDDNSAPVTFDNLQIAATSGTGLESTGQTGTLTISAGSISNANGEGVNINGPGAGVPLAVTLQSVNATGGANGISLTNAAGTFTVTGTGTTAGSGGTISGSASDGIVIGREIGTVSLSNMNVTNPGGDGVNLNTPSATANITLTNLAISGAGNNGVDVQNNAGTVTVSTSTIAAAGTGVNAQNGSGILNVENTTVTGGHTGVNINNNTGTNNLTSLTVNNSSIGINLQNDTGTVNATGTTTVSGSTNFGVELNSNSAPISFSDLEVAATSGTGLFSNNQSGLLTISAGNISSASGTGVQIDTGATAGTPLAVTLTSVSSTNGNNGIELKNAAGTFTVTGTGTTAGTGGTISGSHSDGIQINNEIGTVSLSNINLTNPGASGVFVNTPAATANVALTGLDISGANQDGIRVQNNAGTLTVTDPTITGGNQDGINVNGNTGTVTVANGTITGNTGVGVNVNNSTGTLTVNNTTVTGGTTGLSLTGSAGTNTIANFTSNGAATGISLQSDTTAINFTGTTATSGSSANGVFIDNVTGPISFATLNINAPTGVGFLMENSATTLTIGGGTIVASAGDGVDISGNTVLAVTLGSVSASGGAHGIDLSTVSGSFTVNGGTISGTSAQGVLLDGFGTVSLNNMTIGATASEGVAAITGTNLTVNNSFINTTTTGGEGIFDQGVTGTTNITGNVIEFANTTGISLIPITAGGAYNIDSNILISTSTTSPTGLYVFDVAVGNNALDVSGNTMFLGGGSSGTGISLFKQTGVDSLSSSSDNPVFATTPFSSVDGAGGSFSGTISVNGTPEP